jgi:diguanylate cyclase (GGDEF)-like protein
MPADLDALLGTLCPMHMRLDGEGHLRHLGPTLRKILRPEPYGRFFDHFTVKRPREIDSMSALVHTAGARLHLELRDDRQTAFRGIMMPLADAGGHFILNLGFGISIVDAVRRHDLTNSDFAATDLAVEMLYLVEAKTAAMQASHRLNLRLQDAKALAEEQALTDTLTGLGNRRALDAELARLAAARAALGVMQIDLDFFKAVNDTLGHGAGDQVLKTVAARLMNECRPEDTVVRLGGDEFTLLLPRLRDPGQLRCIGDRVLDRLAQPIAADDRQFSISASIGTAWTVGVTDTKALLARADRALYASKRAGRARLTLYEEGLEMG